MGEDITQICALHVSIQIVHAMYIHIYPRTIMVKQMRFSVAYDVLNLMTFA